MFKPAELTDILVDADTLREPWRGSVVDSRSQYLNMGRDAGRLKANVFQASQRNIRALLRPSEIVADLFPQDEAGHASRAIMRALINTQARQARLAHETMKFLQHFLLDGHGFFKVSWGIPLHPRAIAAGQEDADQPAWSRRRGTREVGDPAAVEAAWRRVFPRYMIGKNHPVVVVPDPMDVLVDPDHADLLDADWYDVRWWLTDAQMREAVRVRGWRDVEWSRYHSTVMPSAVQRWGQGQWSTNAQGENSTRARYMGLSAPSRGKDAIPSRRRWEVHEFHDLVEGRVIHHVPGLKKFLYDEPMDFRPERPMLVDMKADHWPTSYWVPPDNQQYIALQRDLDAVLNHMRDYVRRHGKSIVLVQKGTDPAELEQIRTAQTAEIVEVVDVKAYQLMNMGGLPGEFLNLTSVYMNFMSLSSGVTPTQQGTPSPADTSATEIAAMTRALNVRMNDLRLRVDGALAEVLGLFVDLNQRYLPESTVVELFGSDARFFNRDLLGVRGPDSVGGKFRTVILTGAASETKENVERQLKLSWYSLLATSPHSNTRAMDEEMHRMFGFDPERFLVPEGQSDLSTQTAAAMETLMAGGGGPQGAARGGGALQGAGRSLGERGGARSLSPDRQRRTGAPSSAAQLSQANRRSA